MKVRKGFVSNSSSASFIVEVKGESKKIFNTLYENIESFQEENYKKLLEENIKWKKKKLEGDLKEFEKKTVERQIKEYEQEIGYLERHKQTDWKKVYEDTDKHRKELEVYRYNSHARRVVEGVLDLKRWCYSQIDDGFMSFSDSCTIYNDWGDISRRKDLIEILAFFKFMRYDVRTRIESHRGSF